MLIWKDIHGWEEYYSVSDKGAVLNKITGNILTGDRNSCGYRRVCLYHKGHVPDKQRFFIHRLVAEHFIPNPGGLKEVNHKNLDRDNNNVENLEWIDRRGNEIHARKNGAKLYRPFVVSFTDGRQVNYDTSGQLADELGITSGAIKFWLRGTNQGYRNYNISSIQYIAS